MVRHAAPSLLCDAMLARLARWLRAAGHDTALAGPGEPDRAVADRARAEGRVLLSCDKALVERHARERENGALLLPDGSLDRQAVLLRDRLGLDWLHDPFGRCLIDNTPLAPLEGEEALRALPPAARTGPGPFRRCPACGRPYWAGSHVRRMGQRLAGWAAGGG